MNQPTVAGFDGRLLVAAVVCVIALGLGWESSRSSTGYLMPGLVLPTTTISPISGDLIMGSQYYPGAWITGDPMRTRRGFQSDVRVVLVPAAAILALMARENGPWSERSLRLARMVMVALVLIAIRALLRGQVAPVVAMAVVVTLASPGIGPAWISEQSRRLLPGRLRPS